MEVWLSISVVAKAVTATFHHSPFSHCVLGRPLVAKLARAFLIQNVIFIFSFLTLVALQAMDDRFAFLKRNVQYLSNRKAALV